MPELPVLAPVWRKHALRDRALLGLLPTVAILAGMIVGILWYFGMGWWMRARMTA